MRYENTSQRGTRERESKGGALREVQNGDHQKLVEEREREREGYGFFTLLLYAGWAVEYFRNGVHGRP